MSMWGTDMAGVSFSQIGDSSGYHTALDRPDRVSPSSVPDSGDTALDEDLEYTSTQLDRAVTATCGGCRPLADADPCTHTRYLHDGILDDAEELLPTFGGRMGAEDHLMLTCTGSEANELALRIAKHHTGRPGVIVTSEAYHGQPLPPPYAGPVAACQA